MKKVMFVLFTMVTLGGAALLSNTVSADDDSVVDEINITVPVSCTLSGTGMNTHNATINNGQYNSAIGETALKAFCNDNNGFAIYAIGFTDDTDGKNVLTNSTLGSTYDIATGTATSGNTSNWAMKLSTVSSPAPTYPIIVAGSTDDTEKEQGDPDYTSFQEVPDDYEKVAYRTAGTDIGTGAEGSTIKTTYQAYINATQPAGTYTGQVKYTLVHPYSAAAPVACKPNGTTISTIACMQDVTSSNKSTILASMTEDQQYTLTDIRDGKAYTVAKLKDGNIWMTQNLDLDLDSSTVYTNLDTDIGYDTSTGEYNTASWSPSRSTYTTSVNNIHEWCVGGTWDSTYHYCQNKTPESYDPGDLYWNGEISDSADWDSYYNSCDFTTNTLSCDDSLNPILTYTVISGASVPQYHLGNYYNWTAAIAMNDSSSLTSSAEMIQQSICPAGWRLPYAVYNPYTYQSEGDFIDLWNEYGLVDYSDDISTIWSNPLFFAPSGDFSGSLENIGFEGRYYSSVSGGENGSYSAYFNVSGYISEGANINRVDGLSVRCIAR